MEYLFEGIKVSFLFYVGAYVRPLRPYIPLVANMAFHDTFLLRQWKVERGSSKAYT